ncbi:MAG: calcium/sodium antiporter [Patescibacteria group bacterium]|nr:calcium/sodium antiporter [Patescibacteria group bacterium]
MIVSIILLIAGLALLVAGAEGLVRGASSLAVRLRIPALVIGLTIVSFGTSAPELTVNLASAFNSSPDLAIGNVVGSNIANILLILGICAFIRPLTVKSSTVWKEIPLALLGVVLLFVIGNDVLIDGVSYNVISRSDGIVLLSLMAIFMYYIVSMARSDKKEVENEGEESITQYGVLMSILLISGGLIGLVLGGNVLVTEAVDIAKSAGLSEAFIGLTIVGVGTSLPELATSVVATRKKQDDIAVGNIVGSNIFNVFFILGLTAVITKLPFNAAASTDVLVAVGATALLFVFMFVFRKHKLTRLEGGVFLAVYLGYIVYLVNRG